MRSLLLRRMALCASLWVLAAGMCMPSSWYIQTVDSVGDLGDYTSIFVDSSGYPHISYHAVADLALKYAAWNGSAWEVRTVETGTCLSHGRYSSVALDNSNRVHISYKQG